MSNINASTNPRIIEEIDRLKRELDKLRSLPADVVGRIEQKLRLESNYHSNSIEGNSLTLGETKSLIYAAGAGETGDERSYRLVQKDEIAAFCRRNHIRRMALFGSVLRDDFTPESDVDVLVEFEPDARIGYIGLAGLETELDKILGRKADLYTFGGIKSSRNWLLRKEILNSAEVQYEQQRSGRR